MGLTTSRLHPDLRGDLRELLKSVGEQDGEAPLSEYKEMRIDGRLDARERVAFADDGSLVGYGQAAWHRGSSTEPGHWAVEIVVDSTFRGTGVGRHLIESLRRESGGAEMTLWARLPYVVEAARSAGWYRFRELLEMRRSLPIACLDTAMDGLTLTTFSMGVDEAAWLAANNAAFAGHPENGSLTRRDLEHRIAQKWFDAEGFFLAWDGDQLAGSCWTKIHDDGTGEIYLVGVVPGWEGRGLGRALVCHGLDYLGRIRHVGKAKLFAEADNERAVSLYAKLGFDTARIIEAYRYSNGG